jgi:hypothetical protein
MSESERGLNINTTYNIGGLSALQALFTHEDFAWLFPFAFCPIGFNVSKLFDWWQKGVPVDVSFGAGFRSLFPSPFQFPFHQ